MKCRFIEEYANFQRKQVNSMDWLSASEKGELIAEIDNCVKHARRGTMCVNECMRALTKIVY